MAKRSQLLPFFKRIIAIIIGLEFIDENGGGPVFGWVSQQEVRVENRQRENGAGPQPLAKRSQFSKVNTALVEYINENGGATPCVYRQLGSYAGRILKGDKPMDLTVVQASKFDFVINA